MAISSEIEKLERRWQQTSGLVFAPLAEAYRKAGLHARALEVLEQGLALHAEYGPALIVRARCHLDMGDLDAAEAAFNQALVRDPLDPIALRGLADVCERSGRLPEAIERLRALVDVDPRNSEARVILERLLATPAPAREPEPVPPPSEPVQMNVEPPRDQLDSLDFDVVNLSAGESLPALPEERTAAPVEEDFLVQTFATEPLEVPVVEEVRGPILWNPAPNATAEPSVGSATSFEAVADLELTEPVESVASAAEIVPSADSPGPVEPVVAAAPDSVAPSGLATPSEPVAVAGPVDTAEPVELEASDQPTPEPETPLTVVTAVVEDVPLPLDDAFDEFEEVADVGDIDAFEEPALPEPVAAAPEFEAVDVGEAVELAESVEAPEPVVEEPTVEEYASRVDVPLEIDEVTAEAEGAAAAPEPVSSPVLIVTESMAELFLRQGHRELGLAVYRQLLERDPGADHLRGAIARLEQELAPPPVPSVPPPVARVFAAAETGGRSVERRLQAVLHAPPPSSASTVLPPAIEPGAEPTRASGEALSLASVFGDEPAQPRREAEPPPPAASNEPSYDEFFGAGPAEPAASPTPRGEGEDLRQFNDWLKGLKR